MAALLPAARGSQCHDNDDNYDENEMIAVGLRSMMSAESLELTNHRTISKPASTAGPDGKISFLFFNYYFFYFLLDFFPAWASDWLFVFHLCITSCTAYFNQPPCLTFGL